MFLAINELVKEKARFILIVAVIALVSYLTFFLTALAYGLATSYTSLPLRAAMRELIQITTKILGKYASMNGALELPALP